MQQVLDLAIDLFIDIVQIDFLFHGHHTFSYAHSRLPLETTVLLLLRSCSNLRWLLNTFRDWGLNFKLMMDRLNQFDQIRLGTPLLEKLTLVSFHHRIYLGMDYACQNLDFGRLIREIWMNLTAK